jgi:hypothetical protein
VRERVSSDPSVLRQPPRSSLHGSEMATDETTKYQLQETLHVELIPGTEVMTDGLYALLPQPAPRSSLA